MKRSKKLSPVERLATFRENQSATQLAQATEQLREEEARGEQLQGFRNEYLQQMRSAGSVGMSGAALRRYTAFSHQLDQMIRVQEEQVDRSRQQLEQARNDWQSRHGRRQAVSRLVERAERAEQRDAARLEQKQQDESNTSRYARGGRPVI